MCQLELVKVIVSVFTPVAIFATGVYISKRIERDKINLIKEKDWTIKWSEKLFEHTELYNKALSTFIVKTDIGVDGITKTDLIKELKLEIKNLKQHQWDIICYSKFAQESTLQTIEKALKAIQEEIDLMITTGSIKENGFLIMNNLQYELNKAIKNAHKELLELT